MGGLTGRLPFNQPLANDAVAGLTSQTAWANSASSGSSKPPSPLKNPAW